MSSLDIFSVPSTDYDPQGYRMVPYHKLSSSITPMKFSVQQLEDYVDLNRSYFVIDLRSYSSSQNGIVANGNAASDANNTRFVYAVNNLAHTLFKQINLRFNGTLMTEQTDTYAYSAYFQTLLNYHRDDGETLLQPQGCVNFLNVIPTLAAGGVNDDISTTANWAHGDTNALKTLTTPFRGNAVVRLIMPPYLPAFHTGKIMVHPDQWHRRQAVRDVARTRCGHHLAFVPIESQPGCLLVPGRGTQAPQAGSRSTGPPLCGWKITSFWVGYPSA